MDRGPSFDTSGNKDTAPPGYTLREAGPSANTPRDNSAPPPYHLEQVRIPIRGRVPKDSFVTASQLKTHLGLLRAFRELKDRVIDLETHQDVRDKLPPMAQQLGPQERWTWFLELALERSSLRNLTLACLLLTFTLQVPSLGFKATYFASAKWRPPQPSLGCMAHLALVYVESDVSPQPSILPIVG